MSIPAASVSPRMASTTGQLLQQIGARLARDYPWLLEPRRLSDGTLGWPVRMPRTDDCFAAALATCLQISIGEAPDPRIDERLAAGEHPEDIDRSAWAALYDWLGKRGLRMVVHHKVPLDNPRWIGVIPRPGAFMSHCLVMTGADVLWDPCQLDYGMGGSAGDPLPVELRVEDWQPEDITHGLSFQPREQDQRPEEVFDDR